MQKPWLNEYEQGVPKEIDLRGLQSLSELLEQSFQQFADQDAFESFDVRMTYAQIDQHSKAFAAWLQSLGLEPGSRVAIMMPNLLQYPIALFGVIRAGMVVVNTNPLYTPRELKHQLKDSGAKVVVVVENFAHVVAEVLSETSVEQVVTTGVGDLLGFPKGALINFALKYIKKQIPAYQIPQQLNFKQVLAIGQQKSHSKVTRSLDDIAFLQYTGGTTGVAKGAMLTNKNILSNVEQSHVWLTAASGNNNVIITALPLYHVFALTANCLFYFKIGALNRLIANPRDMPAFVKTLAKQPFTTITGVNTLFNALLNTPGFTDIDFSQLKFTLGGGMAVQRAVAEKWKQVTGKPLIEAYGLTESSPAACINPSNLQDFNGAIGLPISSTECCIVDDDGEQLASGEIGELCIRGPQVMKGYWQRPEATAKTLTEDGWLKTGDIAKMDEKGYFYIVDRKKDMILVSGFNVYPNEIEDVLVNHPSVLEVGAIGVEDEKSGELVKAIVVRKDSALTSQVLRDFARQELTGYKVPKYIQFVDELPKTNVGKILRKDLRAMYGDKTCD